MRGGVTVVGLALAGMLLAAGEARAQAPAAPQTAEATMLALIQLLVAEGVITPAKAQALLEQAQKLAAAAAANQAASGTTRPPATPPDAVRVPYVPEVVRNQIRDQVKQELLAQAKQERWGDPGTLPEWLDRVKISGDVRVRGRGDYFDGGNFDGITDFNRINDGNFLRGDPVLPTINTTEDDTRGQLRARLAIDADLGDGFATGIRLATGNDLDPVSTNFTLGTALGNDNFNLDRAFVRFTRDIEALDGNARLVAGRFANPFFSTELVFDNDLNFDGVAGTWTQRVTESAGLFLTAGFFPLENLELSGKDKSLYAVQLGGDWRPSPRVALKGGLAYYRYTNVTGDPDDCDAEFENESVLPSLQYGNSLFDVSCVIDPLDPSLDVLQAGLASEFRLVNLTAEVDVKLTDEIHLVATGDLVINTGYDRGDVRRRVAGGVEFTDTGDGGNLGWLANILVGKPDIQKLNDWNLSIGYRYIEPDAVLSTFTSSDFHLGGTNAKGFVIEGNYGLNRFVSLTARLYSTQEIEGPRFGADTVILDLNARF